jgi:hypothetical protein
MWTASPDRSDNINGDDMKVLDLDWVFLSYDEPAADHNYNQLLETIPHAKRLHGVKGFDAAHKCAADLAETERFILVDGDHVITPDFHETEFEPAIDPNVVHSWAAKNNVNNLIYGTGGAKCWNKHTLMNINTHEAATHENYSIDFCYGGLEYQPMGNMYSGLTWISGTPYQAYRSGFRDVIKMCVKNGEPVKDILTASGGNLARLLIWCTIGRDQKWGDFAMLGARQGVYNLFLNPKFDYHNIIDYDWFDDHWEKVSTRFSINPMNDFNYNKPNMETELNALRHELKTIGLPVVELYDDECEWYRMADINPTRIPPFLY